MKVTINLTKQEAIESLLQFYKHTGASEIIISDDEQIETEDGWISNVGRDSPHYPESLGDMTEIEVKRRAGEIHTGFANDYGVSWRETDGCLADIIAYRILKD